MPSNNLQLYWKAHLKLLILLLCVWFTISILCGIVWVEYLNRIAFFGYKLGFWFAQQGAIYGFIALIFIYAHCVKRLKKKYVTVVKKDD